MTTAQQNALAQELARNLTSHFNTYEYAKLVLRDKGLSDEELASISNRLSILITRAQIPPELLQSEVTRSNWEGEL